MIIDFPHEPDCSDGVFKLIVGLHVRQSVFVVDEFIVTLDFELPVQLF